ncbi:MAG TPA: hypothetical protein VF516_25575 [Kofleriaceae bacterium]
MKVENGEKSMKITLLWKSALVVSALLVFLFAILGEAAPMGEAGPQVATPPSKVTTVTFRPFSEFLAAQRIGGGDLFFPPVKNYVGWTTNQNLKKATLFALVDYAGLADDFLNGQLGTQVDGLVTETELPNGSARITVALTATNALGFAQVVSQILDNNTDLPFLNTPTFFGNKAQDVANGAEAAVGDVSFLVTFTNSEPGAPLPNLIDVITNINKHPEFKPVNVTFIATVPGPCENGTRDVLHVDQEGAPGNNEGTQIVEVVSEPCS